VESNPGHSNFAARRRSLAPKDKGSLGLKKKLPVLVVPATAAEAANRRLKTENRAQDSGDGVIPAAAPGIAAEKTPDSQV